ncbi:hypothetical protein [Peijinzhouia sedimentorum]
MPKTKHFLSVISAFFLISISCTSINELYSEFVQKESVKLKTVRKIKTLCPTNLKMVGSHLVLVNDCGDNALQIIDTQDWSEHWIGTRGGGPSELGQFIDVLDGSYKPKSLKEQLFVDVHKRNTFYVEQNAGAFKIVNVGKLPKQAFLWENLMKTNNGWALNDLNGRTFLTIIDENEEVILNDEFAPVLSQSLPTRTRGYVYYSTMAYNAERDLVVSGLRNFPYLAIYNSAGEKINSLKTHAQLEYPVFNNDNGVPIGDDAIFFYLQTIPTPKYIFALRSNTTRKRINQGGSFEPVLEIYDWGLKPLAELSFDDSFGQLAIDYKNKLIYGFSFKNENHAVRVAEIPESFYQYFN